MFTVRVIKNKGTVHQREVYFKQMLNTFQIPPFDYVGSNVMPAFGNSYFDSLFG